MKKLLHAPFTLRKRFMEHIEQEIHNQKAGKKAHIMVKANALTDTDMINALYRASSAGVPIDLIIRGPCCLRPQIPGLSENIRVISIIGRFLEHTRAYYFHNDGDERVYLSSADLMFRNLSQRVEVAFAIENDKLKKRVIKEAFNYCLEDNLTSWRLTEDGNYIKLEPTGSDIVSCQTALLNKLTISK